MKLPDDIQQLKGFSFADSGEGGSSVLAEYSTQSSSSSLTWQKSYVFAGSRLLSTITNTAGNEVTEYHHPDRLGTRLISNPVTATQGEQNTLPFGTLIGAETSATNDKRFTSYDRSEIAGGLDYAVNRTYNSGQSRFTQVDPIGMASASIGDPQSLNMYSYVENNPVDFVDPSGLNMSSVNFVCYDITQFGHRSGTSPGDDNYAMTRTTSVCHFFGGGGNPGGSIGGNGGGDDIPRGGGSPLVNLANEFHRRLDNGKCRQKWNDLLKALGNKLSIDDFALGYFLGGIFGGKKKLLFEPPSDGAASYVDFTIRIKPIHNDVIRTESDTNNFEHELAHAASERSQGFTHEDIVKAIAKVEREDFKAIKKQVEARVKAEKKKGNKTITKEGVYSGKLNKWLREVCNPK